MYTKGPTERGGLFIIQNYEFRFQSYNNRGIAAK